MKHRIYTIKIDLVREAKRVGRGVEYKDKMWLIDVLKGGTMAKGGVSFSVKATGHYGRDLKKVFKEIKQTIFVYEKTK